MMLDRLPMACLVSFMACHHEPSLMPSVRVTGEIDGPGPFTITIPSGYTMDPTTASGPIRRWTRAPADPTIELDATAWEEHSSCVRKPTDESVGALGNADRTVLCNNGTGVYVSHFERGDDPLDCYVTYPQKESLGNVHTLAGAAICESVVVDHHSLDAAPRVLQPSITKRIRLDSASGGSANVEVRIPPRYKQEKDEERVYFIRANGFSMPLITFKLQPRPIACEDFPAAKSSIAVPEGIGACDDEMSTFVMSSRSVATAQYVTCDVMLQTRYSVENVPISKEPRIPTDVMSPRIQDAIDICKSVRVIDYQKVGNRTE